MKYNVRQHHWLTKTMLCSLSNHSGTVTATQRHTPTFLTHSHTQTHTLQVRCYCSTSPSLHFPSSRPLDSDVWWLKGETLAEKMSVKSLKTFCQALGRCGEIRGARVKPAGSKSRGQMQPDVWIYRYSCSFKGHREAKKNSCLMQILFTLYLESRQNDLFTF